MTTTSGPKFILTISSADGSLKYTGVNEIQFPAGAVSIQGRKAVVSVVPLSTSTGTSTALDGKQDKDSDLTAIAALTPANDDLLQRKAGAWANRTIAQVKADLGYGTAAAANLDDDVTLAANSSVTLPTQHAVKNYVDNMVAGLTWKASVRCATTANGALATAFANGQVVDGVTLVTGDRILLKNQTTGSENGIYAVNASGVPTRTADADTGTELLSATVLVREGTANADTQWTCTNDAITLGTTLLVFAQISAAGTYVAGSGLTLTGNSFSIASAAITNAMLAGSIDLTTKVTGVLPTARGGTGTAFFSVAGPTVARTYTFPDANATIARTDAAQSFTGNQTFVNKIVSMNGDATDGVGTIYVVKIDTRTGLTAALGATTIFTTPAGDGFYEISGYLVITTAGTSGTISFTFAYTDADTNTLGSTQNITSANLAVNAVGNAVGTTPRIVKVKASSNIVLATSFNSIVGAPVYNLYLFIKRIG